MRTGTDWWIRDRGGFVMIMVVLLLFAISVAGATGYQIVRAEADLASGGEEAQKALAGARAGLERYVGEHIGEPGADSFTVGDAEVAVTARRLLEYEELGYGDTIEVYLIEAVAEVADPRFPGSPARRTVRQYARLHLMPIYPLAGLVSIASAVVIDDQSVVQAGGTCETGNTVGGVANVGTVSEVGGGDYQDGHIQLASYTALLDSINVRWSILTDAQFTIPGYMDSWPVFSGAGAIPSDSFPVIRWTGNFTGNSTRDGRGILIVTGDFTVETDFDWDGIILAGRSTALDANGNPDADVDGMVITGLNGTAQTSLTVGDFDIDFDCNEFRDASRSIAYFELIDGTRWEF